MPLIFKKSTKLDLYLLTLMPSFKIFQVSFKFYFKFLVTYCSESWRVLQPEDVN